MTTKTTSRVLLFVTLAVAMLMLASCATPAQTAAVATAGTGALIQFVNDLTAAGVIDAATAAKLQASAVGVHDVVAATTTAVHTIAEALGQVKAQVASQAQLIADAKVANSGPSGADLALIATGVATVGAKLGHSAAKKAKAA